MLAALLRRFASREAVLATAAQAALTWGANHLSAQVAEQAQRLAELQAELETTRRERDHTLEAFLDLEREHEAMRDVVNDYQLAGVVENRKTDKYPAAEDVDPLSFGVASETPGGPTVTIPVSGLWRIGADDKTSVDAKEA